MVLPDGWVIPVTTQKYDFRKPTLLSKRALERPPMLRPVQNLGQNGKNKAEKAHSIKEHA